MTSEFNDESSTPWSNLGGIGALRVNALGHPAAAEIAIPGSKSVSNRALILAAMSDGTSRLSGLLRSDDTYWCLDALRRLGARIDFDRAGNAIIRGIGRSRPKQGDIHVGSAGTLARFLPPLLAAGDYGKWRMTASSQMSGRPMEPLFQALADGGATVSFLDRAGCFPVMMTGDTFRGGQLRMSGSVSSQFISGILMGAPQSRHGVVLDIDGPIVQSDYVRITLDVMRHFGSNVDSDGDLGHFDVAPGRYHSRDLDIEADASTATYFAALAAVTGGRIVLANLTKATRQPDFGFLEVLERLGCKVDPRSTTTVVQGAAPLRGGFSIDMRALSDAALTLSAVSPFADAPITITGVEHIRHHECDRIQVICRSLSALGVPVEEHQDGLTVSPARPKFAVLDSCQDHRVAMSLAVLGAGGNGIEILNPAAVSKTCPSFFELLASVGVRIDFDPT